MSTFSRYSSTILTVKQFPLIFKDRDRVEFLEHFGAIRVSCLSRYKHQTNLIVADFGSPAHASQALTRLHQLEILRRRLVVEYCPLELATLAFSSVPEDPDYSRLHGISPGTNQIHYPLPSERLHYIYPPLDENILRNINDALWSVPAFYTQVLHLMNKMSLPCPMTVGKKNQITSIAFAISICMFLESMNIHRSTSLMTVACQTDDTSLSQLVNMDTDDDESEIDDGEEEKRIKRRYRPILSASSIGRDVIPTIEIDMTIDRDPMKKKHTIELKIPQTIDPTRIERHVTVASVNPSEGFGQFEPIQSTVSTISIDVQEKEPLPPLPLVPLEEIVKNRLNEEQLRLIDNGRLYRNYQRGERSRRLYIKNLHPKNVDERILHSIYDRYRTDSTEVDIRLLREGKMKGQAFVTLPNEDLATQALDDTNGYVLHEKPMVVQFARTAKAKDDA